MVEARVRWRAEEEAALDLGVQQLGAGHWADILSAHKAAFDPCRICRLEGQLENRSQKTHERHCVRRTTSCAARCLSWNQSKGPKTASQGAWRIEERCDLSV